MPNYNITIDSKFDPYSFEDYLKPAMLMQEQHNALAEAYAESLARSASLADALNSTGDANDAVALQAVNDYENNINKLSADLAQNGLNRANRRGIYDAKSKYGYIDSLKKAMDNRNTFIAQQNELLKDPTRRVSDYAYNHGITRFLNPDFTYGSFSEAAIQKQVEDTVKYLAKSTYLRDPDNPQFKHIAGLTKLMQESTGARPEEIDAAMQAIMSRQPLDEKQSKIAQMLYNDAMDIAAQHLGDWNWDDKAKRAAYTAASKGLYSALGTEENKIFNITEPKESRSSGRTPKTAPRLSMRYNNLIFGDSEKDRTGVTGAIDRWVANRYNKNIAQPYLNGRTSELLNDPGKLETVFGLTKIGSGSEGYVDGITDTIEVAKAMGLSEDTINKLTKINNEIQKQTVTSARSVNIGNQTATFYDTVSKYEPTAEAINIMKNVWNEYNKRVETADAMMALSFEIPATQHDIERTFNKILSTQGKKAGHGWGDDRYDNIMVINGFTEDGIPRVDENNTAETRLTVKEAENAKNVQFSAVPITKKQGKTETTDLYYIMTVDGKNYLVPDSFIPKNLKPDNLKSVDEYVQIQRDYDRWAKNVDFNNLSDNQYLQYSLYNDAIGSGSSALGRSAAMALIGPEWGFNTQHINASDSQASNY